MILLASFHDPAVVFEQLSLIYSLPRYLIRSFRLILPFFPTGTMERIDTEGQVGVVKRCGCSGQDKVLPLCTSKVVGPNVCNGTSNVPKVWSRIGVKIQ